MECTWDAALLQRAAELPPELLFVVHHGSNEQYLHALTKAALDPRYTYLIFACCEDISPHICATLRVYGSLASAIATLGRIIPFAPYLIPYAERLLAQEKYDFNSSAKSDEDLMYPLGLFRLLSFDWRTFKRFIKPTEIQPLLKSSNRAVVFLAIRILQIYLSGADHWFEQMIKQYLGEDTDEGDINGQWDNKIIDYRFLSLWEEDRFKFALELVEKVRSERRQRPDSPQRVISFDAFDRHTACIGGILLPRNSTDGEAPRTTDGGLVYTSTIANNLHLTASALRTKKPLLLTGLAGSGKTLLVRHIAQRLGKLDKMVTMHLNEQSDAKLLIGVYTTGDTPGSFVWKPGVLTTAVQEGRWLFIEDLDRAPNEIIGTLLPLIEKGELAIPNRKQNMCASNEFRIIATVRSTTNYRGEQTSPVAHMLGARHWKQVSIEMPPINELSEVANHLYPSLGRSLPQFMSVYERLQNWRHGASLGGQSKAGILRALSPRDLIKWCSRTSNLLRGKETLTSNDVDDVFMEAIDCFAGALPDGTARNATIALIAEELRIDPQRRDYMVAERDVRYEIDKGRIVVGRYALTRSQQSTKAWNGQGSFSANPHTSRMLEKVAAAMINKEPVLLVGETGVGKTTAVHISRVILARSLYHSTSHSKAKQEIF